MRELTPNTKIKIKIYPDFEEILIKDQELIEDAQKYNVGDISKKTGLQKCMVNGRIVWLLPHQNGNFTQAKMQKADLKILAKSAKKAKPDGKLNAPLDRMSYNHLFQTKGKQRSPREIIERAECLPYVRDILERTGKPAEHLISGGNESYSVIGKANINGTEQGIKVIISKHTDGRYFYLSVFSLKKI